MNRVCVYNIIFMNIQVQNDSSFILKVNQTTFPNRCRLACNYLCVNIAGRGPQLSQKYPSRLSAVCSVGLK
jgi:hypothetical protein